MGCKKLTYHKGGTNYFFEKKLKVVYAKRGFSGKKGLNYSTFGSLQPGRNGNNGDYRYGFNGMEKDDEVKASEGNSYDFGARIYDPRVGRWLGLDPLAAQYPSESNYSYANNNPIAYVDPDGNHVEVYTKKFYKKGDQLIEKTRFIDIFKKTVKIEKTIEVHNAKVYFEPRAGFDNMKEEAKQDIADNIGKRIEAAWGGTYDVKNGVQLEIEVVHVGGVKVVKNLEDVNTNSKKPDDLHIITDSKVVSKWNVLSEAAALSLGPLTLYSVESVINASLYGNVPAHEFGHRGNLPDKASSEDAIMDNRYNAYDKPTPKEATSVFSNGASKRSLKRAIKKYERKSNKLLGKSKSANSKKL